MKKVLCWMVSIIVISLCFAVNVFAEEEASETVEAQNYSFSETGEISIDDYTSMEIDESKIVVDEQEIQNYMDNLVHMATTYETIETGTVEEGDIINLDFEGILEGENEPFEGSSATGYTMQIGSDILYKDFENQLPGQKIGEPFQISVTFPEDYYGDMAGKTAVFTVRINSKTVTTTSELNDEFVSGYAAENLDVSLKTVDDLRKYAEAYIYNTKLENAIYEELSTKTHIKSFSKQDYDMINKYFHTLLNNQSEIMNKTGMGQYTPDIVAQMYGFENAEDYAEQNAIHYLTIFMTLDKVAEDNGIEITEKQLDEELGKYLSTNGWDDNYSVEECKDSADDAWILIFEEVNIKYREVTEFLKQFTTVIESARENE